MSRVQKRFEVSYCIPVIFTRKALALISGYCDVRIPSEVYWILIGENAERP